MQRSRHTISQSTSLKAPFLYAIEHPFIPTFVQVCAHGIHRSRHPITAPHHGTPSCYALPLTSLFATPPSHGISTAVPRGHRLSTHVKVRPFANVSRRLEANVWASSHCLTSQCLTMATAAACSSHLLLLVYTLYSSSFLVPIRTISAGRSCGYCITCALIACTSHALS